MQSIQHLIPLSWAAPPPPPDLYQHSLGSRSDYLIYPAPNTIDIHSTIKLVREQAMLWKGDDRS